MKKRSLFAAVAMLIVSAMVLTSATYAWFNVGGGASFQTQKGTVMESSAGVRIKTNESGAKWTDKLFPQNFEWQSNNPNYFVQKYRTEWDDTANSGAGGYVTTPVNTNSAYAPVSTADGSTFYMYSMNSSNEFIVSENASDVANFYDRYQFYLGTVIEQANVVGTFTFAGVAGNSAAGAARAMVFVSTDNGQNWSSAETVEIGGVSKPVIYTAGTESVSTFAISTAISDSVITDDGAGAVSPATPGMNYIMDSADTGWNSSWFTEITTAQYQNASSGRQIVFSNVPTLNSSRVLVKTIIWIEGQDANCNPQLAQSQITSEWSFEVQ